MKGQRHAPEDKVRPCGKRMVAQLHYFFDCCCFFVCSRK